MDVIERLTKQGKDLGYEGETLQTFVKEQQIELRDERKAMREAERERREAENAKREAEAKTEREKANIERENREAEAKLEREKLELLEKIEAQKREAAREAREAEAKIEHDKREAEAKIEHDKREAEAKMERDKGEAEELFKREELETMERIEREKHDIEREKHDTEREKIEAAEKQREAAERQRKEEREAAERHDQLLCDMEKAKLALEQDKINSQQFQQQRDYEFKCQLQDRQHEGELERLEAQKALTQPRETIKAKAPKIPAFNEGKDEMDSYLLRFERYATAQKWEPDTWATGLSALLQGKALDVYALMPKEDALNYDKLKVALLKRYELTEEGFKRKYKKCRPENGETFQQFTTRMKSYFTRWIDMASIEKSYEGLQDLILREQLIFICNRDLELFLREREPKSLEQASKLADQYKEARYVDIVSLTYKNNERSRSRSNSESRSRSRSPISRGPNQGNQGYPRPRVRCYNCGGPHVRRFCPQLKQGIMKAGAVDYRRSRSPTRKVTFQTQEPEVTKEETAKDGNQNTEPKVCGACLILTDAVNYSQATTNEREMVKTSVGSPIKVSSVSSLSEMSTVQGFVGEKPVEVLRDTGCSGVIVSKDLVPESAYTGRSQTMVMVDYSSRVVPEVKVSIDTPYYKGEVLALCVEKPLVGLIIGNIPGARERNNPDIDWVPAVAVENGTQARREGVTNKLKTPSIIDININPEQVSKAQKEDVSLTTTRSRCEANETIGKAIFLKKNDLLYRKFSSPNVEQGKIFEQLIVPEQYRELVMQLAHESIFTGHLSVTSSVHKILAEYYWPGIYRDVKRFVQSCEVCKSVPHEGKSDRNLSNGENIIEGEECGLQKSQMNETSQVSEKTGNITPMTSEDQDIVFNATFMVKVGVCQTFQEGECSTKCKDTLREQMFVTSHVRKTVDDVTSTNVSYLQIRQNGNEASMRRRPTEEYRETVQRTVSFCNITDECRTSPDEFDRKDMIVWIFSFMAMMVMIMASCIGQWTCTLGEIFRKGTECCSKRIRGWLLTGCFIECCRIGIVLLYMTDGLTNFKFSETVMQTMWIYVVMRDVVEGLSMISEVSDRWLRPGKRKFTLDLNGSIANHGKAIWRYVLKRSAERSKVSLREF